MFDAPSVVTTHESFIGESLSLWRDAFSLFFFISARALRFRFASRICEAPLNLMEDF